MKVSLWAEIRRLHEIEKLSQRTISRQLRCCTKTVSRALQMQSPPLPTSPSPAPLPTTGILAAYYQGQRTLSCFSCKDLHQEIDTPTG